MHAVMLLRKGQRPEVELLYAGMHAPLDGNDFHRHHQDAVICDDVHDAGEEAGLLGLKLQRHYTLLLEGLQGPQLGIAVLVLGICVGVLRELKLEKVVLGEYFVYAQRPVVGVANREKVGVAQAHRHLWSGERDNTIGRQHPLPVHAQQKAPLRRLHHEGGVHEANSAGEVDDAEGGGAPGRHLGPLERLRVELDVVGGEPGDQQRLRLGPVDHLHRRRLHAAERALAPVQVRGLQNNLGVFGGLRGRLAGGGRIH
mmetsp:Transcript_20164/g.55935  ORF Transcript_20164/g.55935 Transcript_20164/m.55935 type:complete len:256 (+) Transcript_20164:1546-2313(+)